jgi:hypothetical protein
VDIRVLYEPYNLWFCSLKVASIGIEDFNIVETKIRLWGQTQISSVQYSTPRRTYLRFLFNIIFSCLLIIQGVGFPDFSMVFPDAELRCIVLN